MRVRLPRVTVRWLMVIVAVVALALGAGQMTRRSRDYRDRAEYHRRREAEHAREARLATIRPGKTIENYLEARGGRDFSGRIRSERSASHLIALSEYHGKMKSKYSIAALFPWLPVEPDTPPPD
jgi:membrane protein required for beta-lactamase induction